MIMPLCRLSARDRVNLNWFHGHQIGVMDTKSVPTRERLCSSLCLSTRDRTSLLLEESCQSLGSLVPLPNISNTGACTRLRACIIL